MPNLHEPHDSQTLTARIFRHLRNGIIEGKYKSGDYLVETKLAEELGVSRTPVREAIKQLELEDLAESIPNRGVIVKGISHEDINDIFTIRYLLEGLAAAWAAERIQDHQLEQLAQIIELMEFYTQKKDFSALAKLDSEFHEIIYAACNSRTLKHILAPLHINATNARQLSLNAPERAPKSLIEHKGIYTALLSRNADEARACIEEHILSVGQKNARE